MKSNVENFGLSGRVLENEDTKGARVRARTMTGSIKGRMTNRDVYGEPNTHYEPCGAQDVDCQFSQSVVAPLPGGPPTPPSIQYSIEGIDDAR